MTAAGAGGRERSSRARKPRGPQVPSARARRAILVAWAAAFVATSGSLYYQFGLGLVPCELCWFQRIAMYPLVVVLGYAALAGQADAHRSVLPLAVPGLLLAAYHSSLQLSPAFSCGFLGCGVVQYRLLGMTIPNQALVGFVVIAGAMAVVWRDYRQP